MVVESQETISCITMNGNTTNNNGNRSRKNSRIRNEEPEATAVQMQKTQQEESTIKMTTGRKRSVNNGNSLSINVSIINNQQTPVLIQSSTTSGKSNTDSGSSSTSVVSNTTSGSAIDTSVSKKSTTDSNVLPEGSGEKYIVCNGDSYHSDVSSEENNSVDVSSGISGSQCNEDVEIDHCNVFVKYLPIDIDDKKLYMLFKPFGEIVSSKVMVDHQTGASLGYGFVRYSNEKEAAEAIKKMNGHTVGNKTLLCKYSNAPTTSNTNQVPSNNLYVKPLLPTTTEEQLRELFEKFGEISDVKVMVDKNGMSRQIGFVRFNSLEDATNALKEMNGYRLEPMYPPLTVKYAETDEEKALRRMRMQNKKRQSRGIPIPNKNYNYHSLSKSTYDMYSASPLSPMSPLSPVSPLSLFTSFGFYYAPDSYGNFQYPSSPIFFGTPPQIAQLLAHSTPPSMIALPASPVAHHSHYSSGVQHTFHSVHRKKERNLFVFHLPSDVDDNKLRSLFSQFGQIESVRVITDKETNESKGYGFVKFFNPIDAEMAVRSMDGYAIGGKHLKVSFKTPKNRAIYRANEEDSDSATTSNGEEPQQQENEQAQQQQQQQQQDEQDKKQK